MNVDLDMLSAVIEKRKYYKSQFDEAKRTLESLEKLLEQRRQEFIVAQNALEKIDQEIKDVLAGKFIQTK